MADPALTGADLTLSYDGRTVGRTVVDGARIDLRADRVTALIGPNGSGKSTLLRSLARLHAPRSGSITIGADLDALSLHPKEFAAFSPSSSSCC